MLYRLSYAPRDREAWILPQAMNEPQWCVVDPANSFAVTVPALFELAEQRRQPADARQQQSNET